MRVSQGIAALQRLMPRPATATPSSEAIGGARGQSETFFAREDHQHPRLTSTTYATLDAQGQATVMFSRSFANKPGLNLTETDADPAAMSISLRSNQWMMSENGRFVGVVIQGRRERALPVINALSGSITLVGTLVTALNGVFAALSRFNVFGAPAFGASVSVIAVARSDVSSS